MKPCLKERKRSFFSPTQFAGSVALLIALFFLLLVASQLFAKQIEQVGKYSNEEPAEEVASTVS